jgi:hypothetical protein
VEGDDRQHPVGRDQVHRRGEEGLDLLQLLVHRHAQRLEGARRRVEAADARRPHRAHHRATQVEGRLQLARGARLLDAAGHAP